MEEEYPAVMAGFLSKAENEIEEIKRINKFKNRS